METMANKAEFYSLTRDFPFPHPVKCIGNSMAYNGQKRGWWAVRDRHFGPENQQNQGFSPLQDSRTCQNSRIDQKRVFRIAPAPFGGVRI